MGTNFYLLEDVCSHCGRAGDERHIGKSSAGWCFSLRVYPEDGVHDLIDWMELMEGGKIKDEYGTFLTKDEMLNRITNRGREPRWDKKPNFYTSWADFHARNHSEVGPEGLLRHRIDGRHCVGHGEGTWDLIEGEFS